MGALGLGIVLSLQDKVSDGLEKIRSKLTAFSGASKDMIQNFDAGAKNMLGGFVSITSGVKVFGAFENAFSSSINTAVDFEQAMARVGAVSGATGEDFERLTQQAKELGAKTQFSASQAAASQESLARAGFKTNEIIAAMPGLLNMAAAEGMDLANAADIAASAIAGFGMDASEAGRVADVLAKTSAASNTSIALLGESLKYVAPYAKAVGVDIEQTNAMLGIMANAGIKGSIAGNALKSAFSRLSEEPTAVAKALKSVGVEAKTSTGELRPFPELMKDLSQKMEGMGRADKVGLFNKIFGAAAGGGMLAVMDGVANGQLPELETALYGASGAAQEMADRMNATAEGAMKRLESASEGLRIAIGNHLLPAYTWITDKMAEFKGWLTQLVEEHPIISKAVIGFTSALLGLSGVALILVGALASVGGFVKMWPLLKVMAVSALSSIRAQARMALGSLSGLGAPVIGMIALAGALYLAWRKNLWGIRDMVQAVTQGFKMALSASTDGIAEVDEELANKLKAAGIWDYAVMMGKVFFRVRQFWNGLVEGFKEGINYLKEAFDWLAGIFSPVIESGQELLKFLGILKPVTETQANTWRAFGQLIGRIAPIVLGVIAAFKGFNIITGIIGTVGQAIMGMFSLITAHPVVAVIVALVAAGIYLYNHWDEITENIARSFGWWADWIKGKWQEFSDWWDSWTLEDVFAPVLGFILNISNFFEEKMSELSAWWDSWTFADIFAPIRDDLEKLSAWWDSWELSDIFAPVLGFVLNMANYVEQKMNELAAWWDNFELSDVFAPVLGFILNVSNYFERKANELADWWDNLRLKDIFAPILGFILKAANYVEQKMNELSVWWDNLKFSDVFAPIIAWAVNMKDNVLQKMQELNAWWNSWTLSDIFAPIYDFAIELIAKVKQPFIDFKNWILGLFANLNPFNWELPSWLGGGKTAPSINIDAGKKTVASGGGKLNMTPSYMRAEPYASGGIITQPHLGLVGEAGREAIIPLEDRASGIPLLMAAMNELGAFNAIQPDFTPAPSSPLLIQHAQNQPVINNQIQAQDKTVNVNNQVDVKVESSPVEIYLDGEKIGSAAFRWIERRNIRNGASEF